MHPKARQNISWAIQSPDLEYRLARLLWQSPLCTGVALAIAREGSVSAPRELTEAFVNTPSVVAKREVSLELVSYAG